MVSKTHLDRLIGDLSSFLDALSDIAKEVATRFEN